MIERGYRDVETEKIWTDRERREAQRKDRVIERQRKDRLIERGERLIGKG